MQDSMRDPNSPDFGRRRLITALALSSFLLPLSVQASALTSTTYPDLNRIVALEWLPIELLLTLGITPLAVAEIANYRLWVQEPELAPTVIDLGNRTEPNMELLQQIDPSLILYSTGFGPSVAKMQTIAPAMGFSFNDGSGLPLKLAKKSLQNLAEKLGVPERATAHLALFQQRLAQSKQRLSAWDNTPLLLFTLLDAGHALVFGKGSMFQEVMDELDLKNAWTGDTNFWGSAIVGIEQLATVSPQAQAIFFSHGNDALFAQVQKTPLWQALPFVRGQKVISQPGVWFYGATLSAMRFCDLLESALGAKP